MGPEYFFKSGLWIIPLIMIILCFVLFKLKVFGRGGSMPPWQNSSESDGERRGVRDSFGNTEEEIRQGRNHEK
jgi:hypothetical protein